jgi:Flp pilus assembly protein TadD
LCYGKKGQHDEAIKNSTEAIRLNPKYAAAYTLRGASYAAKGMQDKAKADFEKAKSLGLTPRLDQSASRLIRQAAEV